MQHSYPIYRSRLRAGASFFISGAWVAALLLLLQLAAPLGAVAQVLHGTFAGGNGHSLSIHADGTLWATGDNQYGQLGLGSSVIKTGNWAQVGLATDWVMVAAGRDHTLGLRTNGTLYAWGRNDHGQLGNGTGTNATTPTLVSGMGPYTQVAAGGSHSLALQANGTAWAWGRNDYGQLGIGTTADAHAPVQVSGGGTYVQLAAGGLHSLGLQTNGTAWAWGSNSSGQLSTAGPDASSPTAVSEVGPYTQVTAGDEHSMGLKSNGTAWAWGRNDSGQLGNGGTTVTKPTQVGSASTWVMVAAGGGHSLGLQANGVLYTGGRNDYGQLGNGTVANAVVFVATGSALPTRSTAVGKDFGVAVRADGTLWAWGHNQFNQLGNGTIFDHIRPEQVGTSNEWVQVAAGADYALALKANGTLWAWGHNDYGQLGTGTTVVAVATLANPTIVGSALYTQVAAGTHHVLALRPDGTAWAWGSNQFGQLGNGTNTGITSPALFASPNPTPAQVGTALYTQVSAGGDHSLGLRPGGTAWAWGSNQYGQLGTGSTTGTSAPNIIPAQAGTDVYTQVSAGGLHSLGLHANGSIWAWGLNDSGQLGNATTTTSPPTTTTVTAPTTTTPTTPTTTATTTPTTTTTTNTTTTNTTNAPAPVSGSETYTQVAAGGLHSLGLRADGSIWAWGKGNFGALGNGKQDASVSFPTQEVTGGTTWTVLATGSAANTSLARTTSGYHFASTGSNDFGQLGDGTTTLASRFDRMSPLRSLQPLPVELSAFTATAAGPGAVRLAWATASETNSAAFDVERSTDGRIFGRIATVAAAGSSTALRTYVLTDAQLPPGLVTLHYRLRQVDQNAAFSYSPVRSVKMTGPYSSSLALAPNPARATVLTGAVPGASVNVFDALGQLVLTNLVDASGMARLVLPAGLPAGVYLVRSGAHAVRLAVD